MADDAPNQPKEVAAAEPIFTFARFFEKVSPSKNVNVSDVCTPSIEVPRWKVLCASLVLTAFGADLWTISRYGSATPNWDEWGGLATELFVPYFDSTLSLQQMFAVHVEHRIFTTRVVSLALIAANGIWDPILQMIVNAAIHVALGVCILAMFRKYLDHRAFIAVTIFITLLVAIPYASESLLLDFNTHFYCVLLFGLIALNLVVRESGFTVLRLLGLVAATLSFLSLASGAFVFAVCAIVVIGKRLLGVENGWREIAVEFLLIACFVFALAVTPISLSSQVIGAHSFQEFIGAFLTKAGWPLSGNILGATFVNLPWLILVWRILRRPPSSASVCWAVFAIGLWNGLQFASLAYGRAGATIPGSRYLDICIFGLMINFAYAAVASDTLRKKLLLAGWVAVISAGLVYRAMNIPGELEQRHHLGVLHENNVRAFLATGSFLPGASPFDFSLPFPDPRLLAELLSDKRVQRFLPSNVQDAIIENSGAAQPSARRDRLGSVRDSLLRAGPFLFLTGLVLWFAVLFRSALNRRTVHGH
ncbi:MAG: hypothetical protein E7813_03255 [Bradyrhizobium sp.]|uniref:hypothetical protein n=1 Tax=Bradyrhizobium sp. TaxID=376 RepID=UPI0011F4ACE1|nr:hypothetical protein [Bradyrhizobium sp.]THD73148.1 MAG: hypothetical protein E7813_03255 [Bradyrhizobium sp.]